MDLLRNEEDRPRVLKLLWDLSRDDCSNGKPCPYRLKSWNSLTESQQTKLLEWVEELTPQVRHNLALQLDYNKSHPSLREKRKVIEVHAEIDEDLFQQHIDLEEQLQTYIQEPGYNTQLVFKKQRRPAEISGLCMWSLILKGQLYVNEESDSSQQAAIWMSPDAFFEILFPNRSDTEVNYDSIRVNMGRFRNTLAAHRGCHSSYIRLTLLMTDFRKGMTEAKKKVRTYVRSASYSN
jgi:hypothetical protein